MAKKVGKRYPLLIYEYTLGRWWTATLAISIVLFILWWFLPTLKTQSDWKDTALIVISGAALFMTIFIFLMRKAAYVRPYANHLRLVTPFLRLNISYKRIVQTRATEMSTLFPSSKLSNMQRESMARLMAKTALVIELNESPIPRTILLFFLSPFFFKDKSPHFVLLVEKWMTFSTELESLRSGGSLPTNKEKKNEESILSYLSYDE
ncbi:MAG: hypothetical protein GY755_20480 [Chloroflexi bacterium]|nr:hypothetical protein [Chloroflexota bacterium]